MMPYFLSNSPYCILADLAVEFLHHKQFSLITLVIREEETETIRISTNSKSFFRKVKIM